MGKRVVDLTYFKYDFTEGKDGLVLTPRLKPVEVVGSKAVKKYKKLTASIKIEGHEFDANEESINFMSSILAISNFRFNQLVNSGMTRKEAYAKVYGRTIPWKSKHNVWTDIKVENIADALELAMGEMRNIIEHN